MGKYGWRETRNGDLEWFDPLDYDPRSKDKDEGEEEDTYALHGLRQQVFSVDSPKQIL